MKINSKIYIAGHTGLVGSALVKYLTNKGFTNLILRTHEQLDLLNQQDTELFFKTEKPEYVFLAAAKVGGIMANMEFRADFIYENLQIQNNIIHNSYLHDVKKLLFLGSSCIYPKFAKQPLSEDSLLTSSLEYSNEPYAIAKIAGIKMCESYNIQYNTDYISVMPTNLYGPGDNYDLQSSHVLPALIRKFQEAKENDFSTVTVWGSGSPRREFLFSEDMAEACVFIMKNVSTKDIEKINGSKNYHLNIGYESDISIKDLSYKIKDIVGFNGDIIFDSSKPDGTPVKKLDNSKLVSLGWSHSTKLENGIRISLADFLKNRDLTL